MESFNTLKGFLTGHEPEGMEPEYAHYATLRIYSESELNFEELGAVLQVVPTTMIRRGDRVRPRSPASRGDLWMYRAPVPEEEDLYLHIDALWRVLKPHQSFLRGLKARASVDVVLGYSSNIDHAGVQLPHQSLELFTALELSFSLNIVVLTPDVGTPAATETR